MHIDTKRQHRHRAGRPRALPAVAGILAALTLGGCGDDPVGPKDDVLFTLQVSGETFRTRVSDPDVIADLDARLQSGQEGVVLGALIAGDGGVNAPWGWHWDPETVEVADAAIELCDGRPSMVEADLTYWVGTVGAFCPWGAKVIARDDG